MRYCLVSLVLVAIGVHALDVPTCPHGLDTVLESPACRVHRLHTVSAPYTRIKTSTEDLCVNALRLILLSDPTTLPCTSTLRRSIEAPMPLLTCQFNTTTNDLEVNCGIPPKATRRWWWIIGFVTSVVFVVMYDRWILCRSRGINTRRQRAKMGMEPPTKNHADMLV